MWPVSRQDRPSQGVARDVAAYEIFRRVGDGALLRGNVWRLY